MPPRVLVVVNDGDSGPGSLIGALITAGIDVDIRAAETGGVPAPETLDTLNGLVLLGGGFMPTDLGRAPWLADERRLVEAALQRRMPTLGICLGAQLIAHAAGGTVEADSGPAEKGSVMIRFDHGCADDPLFAQMPSRAPFIQNHVDRITRLPDEAQLLASSETCRVQAFRLGDRCWGTQFHPEADLGSIRRWKDDELRRAGWDKELLLAQAASDEPAMTTARDAMFTGFVGLLR